MGITAQDHWPKAQIAIVRISGSGRPTESRSGSRAVMDSTLSAAPLPVSCSSDILAAAMSPHTLKDRLVGIQYGRVEDKYGWLTRLA